jgi:DNA repair exonuclease SbcCD ATPase subunit
MAEELSDLKTDIALIKKDVKQIERFFAKFDTALEAMSDVSQKVAVHGEILKNTASKLEDIEERIDEHRIEDIKRTESISTRLEEYRRSAKEDHQRLSDQNAINRKERNEEIMKELHKMNGSLDKRLNEVDEKIQSFNDKIKSLENWKWYMAGIGVAVVAIGSQVQWAALFG